MNLDYDKLLDDWTDKVYSEAEKYESIKDAEEFGTTKYFRCGAYAEGLRMAVAMLGCLEKRHSRKYIIK